MTELQNTDLSGMSEALKEATLAFEKGEVPVGAVISTPSGEIIARAHNLVELENFAGAHAEVLAIKAASSNLQSWRLTECTLYVTLEPCPLCISLCVLSRIKRIVFGCSDPRMGACGSLFDLSQHPSLPHHLDIQGGILEDECRNILETFFQKLRKEKR